MKQSTIGLIGLGVMGSNLARNFAHHQFHTTVYNRTTTITDEFIKKFGNDWLTGAKALNKFVAALEPPRKIILLVEAGPAVDAVVNQLTILLRPGDIIVDGGNSHYRDTMRRAKELAKKQIFFVGCGVSGGAEGALHGPSLMPGGAPDAWDELQPILETIAASDFAGGPCVTHIGEDGAGHYVKMVHNGIEYAVVQLMAEAYDIFRSLYQLKPPAIADIFTRFNAGKLQSYLFEISVPVLRKKDDLATGFLIDHILDKAGQKGTGRWTVIDALERNVAISSISEAVFARVLSSQKELRVSLREANKKNVTSTPLPLEKFIPAIEDALYASLLAAYAEGYALIARAAAEENWRIDLAEVSRIWEGGCIIRAKLLNLIHQACAETKKPTHLFLLPKIKSELKPALPGLRDAVALAAQNHLPTPVLAASLAYIDGITTESGPANFIQGLRDYFGAHTYERIDQEGKFHTQWGSENEKLQSKI